MLINITFRTISNYNV